MAISVGYQAVKGEGSAPKVPEILRGKFVIALQMFAHKPQ